MRTPEEWLTEDGQWRVTRIELDGIPLLRVQARGAQGWIWKANARTPEEVGKWLPLKSLREAA